MIAYFDTSAVLPLVLAEPTSQVCQDLWLSAHRVVACRLLYPESRAALAAAERNQRMDARAHTAAAAALDELVAEIDGVDIDESLAHTAGRLAQRHGMRGADAVHLAAALALPASDSLMVTGDRHLREAARAAGMAVAHLER